MQPTGSETDPNFSHPAGSGPFPSGPVARRRRFASAANCRFSAAFAFRAQLSRTSTTGSAGGLSFAAALRSANWRSDLGIRRAAGLPVPPDGQALPAFCPSSALKNEADRGRPVQSRRRARDCIRQTRARSSAPAEDPGKPNIAPKRPNRPFFAAADRESSIHPNPAHSAHLAAERSSSVLQGTVGTPATCSRVFQGWSESPVPAGRLRNASAKHAGAGMRFSCSLADGNMSDGRRGNSRSRTGISSAQVRYCDFVRPWRFGALDQNLQQFTFDAIRAAPCTPVSALERRCVLARGAQCVPRSASRPARPEEFRCRESRRHAFPVCGNPGSVQPASKLITNIVPTESHRVLYDVPVKTLEFL